MQLAAYDRHVCVPEKVNAMENEIQSANEVKVLYRRAWPLALRLPDAAATAVCFVLPSGRRGEADPVPQRDPPEANQQPEGRAGRQGEAHHRAAGVRPAHFPPRRVRFRVRR